MAVAAGAAGAGVAIALWALSTRLEPGPHGRRTADLSIAARRWSFAAVTLLAAAGTASATALLQTRPSTAGLLAMAAAAPALTYIDIVTERLPFAITGTLGTMVAIAFAIDAVTSGNTANIARAGIAATGIALIGAAAGLLPGPDGASAIGGGDIALAAVLATTLGWLGWVALWVGFTAALLAFAAAADLIRRSRTVELDFLQFGPFLFFGWYVAIALSTLGLF